MKAVGVLRSRVFQGFGIPPAFGSGVWAGLGPSPGRGRKDQRLGTYRDDSELETGEDEEVVREDMGSDAAAEGSEGTVEASTHLEDAFQGRDGTLDSGSKTLQLSEYRMMFPVPFLFGPRSFLRDRDMGNASLQFPELGHALVESRGCSKELGKLSEGPSMTPQDGVDQRLVAGSAFEDIVASDELLPALLQKHHVAELDRLLSVSTEREGEEAGFGSGKVRGGSIPQRAKAGPPQGA